MAYTDWRLTGLNFSACNYAWPGAMHERNGEILALVDERADAKQREGLCSRSSRASTASPAPQFSTSSRWW
jgi:hypothetical protein